MILNQDSLFLFFSLPVILPLLLFEAFFKSLLAKSRRIIILEFLKKNVYYINRICNILSGYGSHPCSPILSHVF